VGPIRQPEDDVADSRKRMHRIETALTVGAIVIVGVGFLVAKLFGS
jgi:hypothetical protein